MDFSEFEPRPSFLTPKKMEEIKKACATAVGYTLWDLRLMVDEVERLGAENHQLRELLASQAEECLISVNRLMQKFKKMDQKMNGEGEEGGI